MLVITINGDEFYNEDTNQFESIGDVNLELEHSLVSVSKWESKFKKPFLSSDEKSNEEMLAYIQFMILNSNAVAGRNLSLSNMNVNDINNYIESSESATTFGLMPDRPGRGEVITSELIYYWLVAYNIPFEVETWHLNRLFSLIKICNVKNSKPSKMSRKALAERNKALNEERRAKLGTSG